MLVGYFDESYNNRTLVVSGWVGKPREFEKLGSQWSKHLKIINRKLAKQGRSSLSRYHAADCSSLVGEYDGWSPEEQKEHAKSLLGIISRRGIWAVGYGISLMDLVDVFPDNAHDYVKQAYFVCLRHNMITIGRMLQRHAPDGKIALIHDHTKHNGEIR